jgi:dipeptidyl aminopeptidase/acylaminoacyl peptidase
MKKAISCLAVLLLAAAIPSRSAAQAAAPSHFEPGDLFDLEWVADPQISPDGSQVVYVRSFNDVMTDRAHSNLWVVNFDGSNHRPLTSGNNDYGSPRWSPDGQRLAYVSSRDGSAQIYVRWMDTGETAKITNLTRDPEGLTWSPDGTQLSLSMFVSKPATSWAMDMPTKPEGAEWAKPAVVIEEMTYRADGAGYLEPGFSHLFVLPAEGGTPRQVTSGDFNHGGPVSWTPDGGSLVFSANRRPDNEFEPLDSEIYRLDIESGELTQLTERYGPDGGPVVSPDGSMIAYLGFDDEHQGYQVSKLYVMNSDGSNKHVLADELDRSLGGLKWVADDGLWAQYDSEGNTKLAHITMGGAVHTVAEDLGGLSLGRPYSGAQFSVASSGRFAFTYSTPEHPADLKVGGPRDAEARLTYVNEDVLGHRSLGAVEEIWWESSFDGRRVQGWIATPPNFDPNQKYPLMLEIHGGPFANYGDRFGAEIQIYAAAGFVVLYTNPRGSTSYGQEFGNLIHHNYPGQDYDDLMSGVDAVIERGYIDRDNLFVTGGSGGGVLTAWIVGQTDRFTAAAVQKPVINWYSFVLTSDNPGFFYKYWFGGLPWEGDNQAQYMERSPLSHVGNVTTPTMLITGESDYRTPMSETEQYYAALNLEKVPTAMVRIPDAPHGIARRPSNLLTKVGHILAWFERYRNTPPVISQQ